MLDQDEEHRGKKIKGKCDRTIARRIYIRTSHLDIDSLLSYDKEFRKKALIQRFIPIGVICLTCSYTIGSPAAALGFRYKGPVLKRLRNDLEEVHRKAEENDSDIEEYLEPLAQPIKSNRAERRRRERANRKQKQLQDKYNLKESNIIL